MGIGNFGNKNRKLDFVSPKIVVDASGNKAVIFAMPAVEGEEGAYELTKGPKAKNPGQKYYVKGGNMATGVLSDIKLREDETYGGTSVAMLFKELGKNPVQIELGLLNGDTGAANRATLTLLTQLMKADVGKELNLVVFLEPAGSTFENSDGVEVVREYDQVSFNTFQNHLIDMRLGDDGKPVNTTGYVRFDRKAVPKQALSYVKGKDLIPIDKKSDAPKNATIVYDADSIRDYATKVIETLKHNITEAQKVQSAAQDDLHDDDASFGYDDDASFGFGEDSEENGVSSSARARMGSRPS